MDSSSNVGVGNRGLISRAGAVASAHGRTGQRRPTPICCNRCRKPLSTTLYVVACDCVFCEGMCVLERTNERTNVFRGSWCLICHSLRRCGYIRPNSHVATHCFWRDRRTAPRRIAFVAQNKDSHVNFLSQNALLTISKPIQIAQAVAGSW